MGGTADGHERDAAGGATGAAEILAQLDTGRWSVLHRLFGIRSTAWPGTFRGYVLPYVVTAFASYGVMFVLAATTLPTLTERTPGVLDCPFLLDFNGTFMFTVTLPAIVVLILTERWVLPLAVSKLAEGGVLSISRERAAELRRAWERRYGLATVWGQVVAAAVGLGVGLSTYLVVGQEGYGLWHTTEGRFNAAGWSALFWTGCLYAVVLFFVARSVTALLFLRDLARKGEITVVPFHPDRCGGLRPVGMLGLRNQYAITVVGLNLVLFVAVTVVFVGSEKAGALAGPAVAAAAYLLVGPVVFMAPLMPFRGEMLKAREELSLLVAQAMQAGFGRVKSKLASEGRIDKDDEEHLNRLRSLGEWAEKLPVWPFDASTLTKFLAAYVLPLLALAASAVIGGFIESMAGGLAPQ